jgi:putative FmdB family regulatory protein
MPLFEYECQNCGKVFEELVFTSRIPDEEITCPHCGFNKARKRISAPAIGGFSSDSSAGAPACGAGGFS